LKAITGGRLDGRWFDQLAEAGLAETAITAEEVAALAGDRLGGDGGQLVAPVRLVERTVSDAEPAQPVQALVKAPFIGDATHHEMRVRQAGRKKGPRGLDGRVAGLHNLIRYGEVVSQEEVQVRGLLTLGERHERLLSRAAVLPRTP
jgi:hypothetical protein